MNKIAVFDSGLGGLTVLRRIYDILPYEDLIYYGDSKNAPYGPRPVEEIQSLSDKCVQKLLEEGADTIVIACNTATSAALDFLKEKYTDISFYGIRPDLVKAVGENPGKHILLMATKATCEGPYIQSKYKELSLMADIKLLECPGIVPLVESGKLHSEELESYLHGILDPYSEDTDAVILGCTHFPFVKDTIAECFKKEVLFYDAAESVAETLYCDYVLDKLNTKNNIEGFDKKDGNIKFLNSDIGNLEREKQLFEMYI